MSLAYYESAKVLSRPIRVVAIATLLVVGVLFLLPFTQHLAGIGKKNLEVRTIDVALPPPPPPPPEPPPPEENKPEPSTPELQQAPKPLSLSQLELSLNPGVGDASAAAFGMGAFEVEADAMGDLSSFSVSELDELPRVTRQPPWMWPRHARGRIDSDVTAKAEIYILPDGRVEFRRFRGLSHPIIEREIIEWVEDMRFTPPVRNGKPVRARYALPIKFSAP